MPTKTYKLPEKIANLPAGELEEICKNPGKYDLTIADLFQIGEYASKITSGPADSELKASNAYLKKENERLERNLDDYIERYDRGIFR